MFSIARPKYKTSPNNVLWAQCTNNNLEVDFLVKGTSFQLVHVIAQVENEAVAAAVEWAGKLMAVAYTGVHPLSSPIDISKLYI